MSVSRERRPYSRVYWEVMDDPMFDGIREDVRLFGSWSLLLVVGDMAYPSPAYIPRTVPKATFARLKECGLVEELSGHRFRVRGMVKERETRSGVGRNASAQRWQSERTANGMPSKAEQSRAEAKQSTDTARADDPADAYWQLTGKYPTEKTLGWIDDLTSKFGHEAVIRALAAAYTADRVTATLLGRAQDILRSESRELDRREREDEQRRLREKRAVPRQEEPWRIEQRKAYLERYGPDAA